MKNKFLISSIAGLMIISAFLLVLVVNGNKPLESAPESSGEESHMSVEDNKNENDKDIYGTVGIENSWYADPADPNNLITNESYVVKVEIISIGEAKMLPKTEHFVITSYSIHYTKLYDNEEPIALPLCESEEYVAYGDMLMNAGIKLSQKFVGIGFAEKTRIMGDFDSRLYKINKR